MRKILLYIVCLFSFTAAFAAGEETVQLSKSSADEAYKKNDFQEAAQIYENILTNDGESSVLYYNLGNSYYKSDKIAQAILNYERALLLDPGDKDIHFNLDMARSKTVDKITPVTEIFFVTWIKDLIRTMSVDGWAVLGIVTFFLMLLGLVLYFFGNQMKFKRIGFYGALICLLLTICFNIFASSERNSLINRNTAIIMSPSVTIKSTPNESGTDLFVLHEGTKVFIKDNTMNGWKEIQTEDGNVGWISTKNIEII